MFRRGVPCLLLLGCGVTAIGVTALAQKTPQDKVENNRKQAEALRQEARDDYKQSEKELGRIREHLRDAEKAEKSAAELRKAAQTAKDDPSVASPLKQEAAAEDNRAKGFKDEAAKDRQKADSQLAAARAAWQKSQLFEKTPCPDNLPYCAPASTHKEERGGGAN